MPQRHVEDVARRGARRLAAARRVVRRHPSVRSSRPRRRPTLRRLLSAAELRRGRGRAADVGFALVDAAPPLLVAVVVVFLLSRVPVRRYARGPPPFPSRPEPAPLLVLEQRFIDQSDFAEVKETLHEDFIRRAPLRGAAAVALRLAQRRVWRRRKRRLKHRRRARRHRRAARARAGRARAIRHRRRRRRARPHPRGSSARRWPIRSASARRISAPAHRGRSSAVSRARACRCSRTASTRWMPRPSATITPSPSSRWPRTRSRSSAVRRRCSTAAAPSAESSIP